MKVKYGFRSIAYPLHFLFVTVFLIALSSCKEEEEEKVVPDKETIESLAAIVLPCNFFDTNTLLEDDPLREVDYIIDCFMYVKGDKTITIEPGVVIAFSQDAGIWIDDDVEFVAEGTTEKPILFSATRKGKGYWRGLFFSSKANNSLAHAKIEYAAGKKFTEYSPIYAGSIAVASGGALSLSHVEISNGGNMGLDLTGHSANVSTNNLVITENEGVAVRVCAYQAHIFDSSSTFKGNTLDFINIVTPYYEIRSAVEWKKLDVPYLVDGRVHITDNGYLTIKAGVEVLFREAGYLQASGNVPPYHLGLDMIGTTSEKVQLRGYNQVNWGGIYYGFTNANNQIINTVIAHAKGDITVGNITNTGAIFMHADPKLSIIDSELKDMPNCAYYAYTGASKNKPPLPNFSTTNVTLTNVLGGELCWGSGME